MRLIASSSVPPRRNSSLAFTLAEVVICIAIVLIAFTAIIGGYIQSSARAEWTGYSVAAQALTIQQLEQARSAVWDPTANPPVDEFTNIIKVTGARLDLPMSGTNALWVTNFTTITNIVVPGTTPVVSVKMVQVQTVWPFVRNGVRTYFTNTIVNYFAPDVNPSDT